jgi:hypothetical protein
VIADFLPWRVGSGLNTFAIGTVNAPVLFGPAPEAPHFLGNAKEIAPVAAKQ